MKINLKLQDCHNCRWKRGELLISCILSAALVFFLSYFFYRSLLAIPAISPIGILFFAAICKKKQEKDKEELAAQFRECILAVSTSLQAGYSAENSFVECIKDMRLMYGEESLICLELDQIRRGLNINISLEELLQDFAGRSGCEEIGEFAQIFSQAKRSGGNMAEIIKTSATLIGRQIELRQELRSLLAGKRMELNIMKVMPFGISLYISVSTPGFFDPLYHNVLGVAIMTGCLAVYLTAYVVGEAVMGRMEVE